MLKQAINLVLQFAILFLIQVLICNKILLFNVATPIIFIYFIIKLNAGVNLNALFTIAFLYGLGVDIFSDTPGINAFSLTILAALKRPILFAYMQHDDENNKLTPTLSTMGFLNYSKYMFTLVLIYCLLIFGIEYFSFGNIPDILIMTLSSAVLSYILILGIDSLLKPSRG